MASNPWGACDGSSPWDTNDGVTYDSGTIGSVLTSNGAYTVTDSGSPGWAGSQWVNNGSPYSLHDATVSGGAEIIASTSNSIAVTVPDQSHGIHPAAGDSDQILRATVGFDQPARGAGLLVEGGDSGSMTEDFRPPRLVSTGNPGSVNEVLDPWYEMDDSGPSSLHGTIGSHTNSIIANRDYYAESINQSAQTSPPLRSMALAEQAMAFWPIALRFAKKASATGQPTKETGTRAVAADKVSCTPAQRPVLGVSITLLMFILTLWSADRGLVPVRLRVHRLRRVRVRLRAPHHHLLSRYHLCL